VNVSFVPDDGSPALPVLVGGEPENVDEVRATEILSEDKFEIKIQLGIGEENAKYWTCDFGYVSLPFLSETFFEGLFGRSAARIQRSLFPLLPYFRLLYVMFTLGVLNRSAFFRFLSLLGIREDQRRVSQLNAGPYITRLSLLSRATFRLRSFREYHMFKRVPNDGWAFRIYGPTSPRSFECGCFP